MGSADLILNFPSISVDPPKRLSLTTMLTNASGCFDFESTTIPDTVYSWAMDLDGNKQENEQGAGDFTENCHQQE